MDRFGLIELYQSVESKRRGLCWLMTPLCILELFFERALCRKLVDDSRASHDCTSNCNCNTHSTIFCCRDTADLDALFDSGYNLKKYCWSCRNSSVLSAKNGSNTEDSFQSKPIHFNYLIEYQWM